MVQKWMNIGNCISFKVISYLESKGLTLLLKRKSHGTKQGRSECDHNGKVETTLAY